MIKNVKIPKQKDTKKNENNKNRNEWKDTNSKSKARCNREYEKNSTLSLDIER